MQPENEIARAMAPSEFTDAMIRIGLIALMAVLCFRVFSPFLSLMVWAMILAITIYPLHQRLARRFGGKQGRASTVIVVVGCQLFMDWVGDDDEGSTQVDADANTVAAAE